MNGPSHLHRVTVWEEQLFVVLVDGGFTTPSSHSSGSLASPIKPSALVAMYPTMRATVDLLHSSEEP